jgi:hypothetical protein
MTKTDEDIDALFHRNRASRKKSKAKPKAIEKQNKYVYAYLGKNQAKRLFNTMKQRAKASGMECDLSESDIVIPETCKYLGCELTNEWGVGRVWTNASIDRIDSSKGYVKGNIQIISDLANRMKQNATPEQLVAFAKGVLKVHSA